MCAANMHMRMHLAQDLDNRIEANFIVVVLADVVLLLLLCAIPALSVLGPMARLATSVACHVVVAFPFALL